MTASMRDFLNYPIHEPRQTLEEAVLKGLSHMSAGQSHSERDLADLIVPVVKDHIRKTVSQYAEMRGEMAKLVAHQLTEMILGEQQPGDLMKECLK